MLRGHVTRLEPVLGFGFLCDDAGVDWFFVRGGVRHGAMERLHVRDRVTFDIESTPTGPRAADIAPEYPPEVA
jgi:cold shock CspA family protein